MPFDYLTCLKNTFSQAIEGKVLTYFQRLRRCLTCVDFVVMFPCFSELLHREAFRADIHACCSAHEYESHNSYEYTCQTNPRKGKNISNQ